MLSVINSDTEDTYNTEKGGSVWDYLNKYGRGRTTRTTRKKGGPHGTI